MDILVLNPGRILDELANAVVIVAIKGVPEPMLNEISESREVKLPGVRHARRQAEALIDTKRVVPTEVWIPHGFS